MSLASFELDIKNFIAGTETDAEKFYKAFTAVAQKAPSAIATVQNFINELAPVIVGAVALAVPTVGPEVAGALALVQIGLAGLQASVSSVQTGTSLLSNLQNFAATVPQLLASLEIKDPNLVALITRIVNLVTSEAKVLIPAVQAWVTAFTKSQAPALLPA